MDRGRANLRKRDEKGMNRSGRGSFYELGEAHIWQKGTLRFKGAD